MSAIWTPGLPTILTPARWLPKLASFAHLTRTSSGHLRRTSGGHLSLGCGVNGYVILECCSGNIQYATTGDLSTVNNLVVKYLGNCGTVRAQNFTTNPPGVPIGNFGVGSVTVMTGCNDASCPNCCTCPATEAEFGTCYGIVGYAYGDFTIAGTCDLVACQTGAPFSNIYRGAKWDGKFNRAYGDIIGGGNCGHLANDVDPGWFNALTGNVAFETNQSYHCSWISQSVYLVLVQGNLDDDNGIHCPGAAFYVWFGTRPCASGKTGTYTLDITRLRILSGVPTASTTDSTASLYIGPC